MKPNVNTLFVGFCLFLFALGTVLQVGVSLAQEDPTLDRSLGQQPPVPGEMITFQAGNLCRASEIRDNAQVEYTRVSSSALVAVIDQDPKTYLSKSCTPDQWLDIRFLGARRWVNFVEIQYVGGDDFKFDIFNFKGERQKINVISAESREGPGATQIKIIEFEPVRAKGIRWSWASAGPADESIAIHEISVWFRQLDPDDKQPPDDAENWLLCENITGMGTTDMAPLWNTITALPDWCPNMSHWCHWWQGLAAWDGDFTCAAAGGFENTHSWPAWPLYTGMDYHDLSVVALHGSPCNIFFPNPNHIDGVLTAPGDVAGCWGDGDAEWFCALSCSPYACWFCPPFPPGQNCALQWATAFNGLHMQCGFTTTAYATGGAFLGDFANNMISTGLADPALPIGLSWWLAKIRFQPAGTCCIVLVDSWLALLDHLWGQGWVSPDPSPPGGIVWGFCDPPVGEGTSGQRGRLSSLDWKRGESVSQSMSGPSSMTLPARSSTGMPVKTTEQLYTMDLRDEMTVYLLDPLDVDSGFVLDLTQDLCVNYGTLCSPAIGQDTDGNWWATEDEFALWCNPEQGIIQLVNVDEFIAKKDSAPALPDTSSAGSASQTLLSDLGLSLSGSYATGYFYNAQVAYDVDLMQINEDSSFNLSINADFYRIVGGFPVFGPGGYVTVTWGEGLELLHFTRGGWQDLVSPSVEPIISVSEAIDLLTTQGEDATIGGIPPICDTLLIDATEQAYYNTNGEYETDILEPIYHFSCLAVSEYDTVPCDIFVPARASLLRGGISQPLDHSTFDFGDTVTFVGYASGGTPPYTYEWYSDIDGYLGSGSTFMTDDLTPVYKDTVLVGHTITLKVTDYEDNTASVTMSLYIVAPPGITVIWPNGGEILRACEPYTIRWISIGFDGNVRIDYSLNSGASFDYAIVASYPDTGAYTWMVPHVETNHCRIRVCDAVDCNPADASDNDFKIVACIPMLTNYGVILLLVLLIASAIWMISRRKLATQRHR